MAQKKTGVHYTYSSRIRGLHIAQSIRRATSKASLPYTMLFILLAGQCLQGKMVHKYTQKQSTVAWISIDLKVVKFRIQRPSACKRFNYVIALVQNAQLRDKDS